jgi:hypothetical protein
MAIGAAVGGAVGALAGVFGGGDMRRQREAAERERIQASYMTDLPSHISRVSGFGDTASLDLETSVSGRILRYSRAAPVVVNINVEALDVQDFERRTGYLSQAVAQGIMRGGTQIGDSVAWAAGAY